jgi:hypothetical protein
MWLPLLAGTNAKEQTGLGLISLKNLKKILSQVGYPGKIRDNLMKYFRLEKDPVKYFYGHWLPEIYLNCVIRYKGY